LIKTPINTTLKKVKKLKQLPEHVSELHLGFS